jgi:peptidoglycan/LPS O-acetylase OafA/YrhL
MTTNLTGETNQFYFPGLNGLRFLAALVVILQHIEYFKSILGFNQFACTSFIFNLGGLGVSFFFVLSGFLITFLLLTEKLQYNSISIKNFYIKRILRIWPVYYLLVLCGLFIFPHIGLLYNQDYKNFYDNFGTKVILFMLFFPNVALIKFGVLPFIAPTWSVGVEEQFYLIWPWLIRLSKKYLLILILITLSASFVFHVASYLSTEVKNAFFAKSFFIIKRFLKYFRIGSMAIGGIGAYLLILKKQSVLNIIYRIELLCLFVCIKSSPLLFLWKNFMQYYFASSL